MPEDPQDPEASLNKLPLVRRMSPAAFEWTASVAFAAALAACSVGDVTRESSAPLRPRPARVWLRTETTLADSYEGATEEKCNLTEIALPEIQVPPQAHMAPSNGSPAPKAEVTQVESPGDPRPVKVPWPGTPEATSPDDTSDDDSDGVTARPVPLPGRVRVAAPSPCCLRHPKECREFAAAAKIEGTLASRRVESMQLRAHPFGKAGP
jgi:hypothetical protein